MTIKLIGLDNIPLVDGSSDIALIIKEAIDKQGCSIEHGDIILIAETLISKSEENFIRIDELDPSDLAFELAEKSKKDPKLVQAILNESNEVVEVGPNFIITETKHGFVCANAGIDESNVGEVWLLQCPSMLIVPQKKLGNTWKRNSMMIWPLLSLILREEHLDLVL